MREKGGEDNAADAEDDDEMIALAHGMLEEDNAVLDEYCQHERISTLDNEADIIYVNGSNNLPNLKRPKDTWKVRLIEEDFLARMWEEDDNA